MRWLDGISDLMDMSLSKLWEMVRDCAAGHAVVHRVTNSWTWLSDWTTTTEASPEQRSNSMWFILEGQRCWQGDGMATREEEGRERFGKYSVTTVNNQNIIPPEIYGKLHTMPAPEIFQPRPEEAGLLTPNTQQLLIRPYIVSCLVMSDSFWPHGLQPARLPEYWGRLPFPSPGALPESGIKLGSPALQADSLPSETPGKPRPSITRYHFLVRGANSLMTDSNEQLFQLIIF